MAIAKKGTRTIEVNDVKYRWVVKPNDESITLVVELADNPGQKMITSVDFGNIISPWLVRKAILYALDRGWHPQQKGQEIILHLEQSPSSNNYETGVLSEGKLVLKQVFQESQKPATCPVCGVDILGCRYQIGKPIKKQIYKGERFIARSGLWEWCSNCHTFYQHRSKKR